MKGRKLFAFSRPPAKPPPPSFHGVCSAARPLSYICTEEKQPADGSNAELQQSNKCGLTKVPHPPKKNFPPSAPGRPCSARGVLIQSLNLESRGGIGKVFFTPPGCVRS